MWKTARPERRSIATNAGRLPTPVGLDDGDPGGVGDGPGGRHHDAAGFHHEPHDRCFTSGPEDSQDDGRRTHVGHDVVDLVPTEDVA